MIRFRCSLTLALRTLLIVLLLLPAVVAQTPIKADWICSFDGRQSEARVYFDSGQLAQVAVSKIIRYTGLVQNFSVAEADVSNASAFVRHEKRVILYNQSFIERIVNNARSDWAATGILAHEVGHHLLGHTIQSKVSRDLELDADRFAGFILQKMGAPIEDAEAGWHEFASNEASASHPAKDDRLRAVRKGWTAARDLKPLSGPPAVRVSTPKTMPNELWFVTMSRANFYTQRYDVVSKLISDDFIHANWNNGYYITSVARGNARWIVIVDKNNPSYTHQIFRVSPTVPGPWIKEKWNQGYRITAASYGDQTWVVVMTSAISLTFFGIGYILSVPRTKSTTSAAEAASTQRSRSHDVRKKFIAI